MTREDSANVRRNIAAAPARQKGDAMRTLELVLVIVAVAAITIWRGIALYKISLKRKDL